jgi:hypothetical protein
MGVYSIARSTQATRQRPWVWQHQRELVTAREILALPTHAPETVGSVRFYFTKVQAFGDAKRKQKSPGQL